MPTDKAKSPQRELHRLNPSSCGSDRGEPCRCRNCKSRRSEGTTIAGSWMLGHGPAEVDRFAAHIVNNPTTLIAHSFHLQIGTEDSQLSCQAVSSVLRESDPGSFHPSGGSLLQLRGRSRNEAWHRMRLDPALCRFSQFARVPPSTTEQFNTI